MNAPLIAALLTLGVPVLFALLILLFTPRRRRPTGIGKGEIPQRPDGPAASWNPPAPSITERLAHAHQTSHRDYHDGDLTLRTATITSNTRCWGWREQTCDQPVSYIVNNELGHCPNHATQALTHTLTRYMKGTP